MSSNQIVLTDGFPPVLSPFVAELFWKSYEGKLSYIMGDAADAVTYFTDVANPNFAISAMDHKGELQGIAGFKTSDGAIFPNNFAKLKEIYGFFGAVRRYAMLSTFNRKRSTKTLMMEGIFVSEAIRKHGVGTELLDAVKHRAEQLGCGHVRVNVVDIDPFARIFYEKNGFIATRTRSIGPLRWIFGFRNSTTLIFDLAA